MAIEIFSAIPWGEILGSIEFQMSFLLFVSLGGYLLAARINQSAVIGLILIGFIIGPSLLGLIEYTEFVESLAHLGAVILLFVIGLEFKLRDVFDIKYLYIALIGVIVPWIGGFFIASLFGYGYIPSIFVGTAMTATSIAITANVLKEMGKLQTDAAKAIIGAAVFDDVLSLIALSVTVQAAAGTVSLSSVAFLIIIAAIFLVAGTFIGYKYLRRWLELIDESKLSAKFRELAFIAAMMIAFLYATVAELIGLSAIVGAFIAGVSLEGACLKWCKDFREGADYLHIIFASIFFVSLGIIADVKGLDLNVLVFLGALTVVAVLTKVLGCALPARIQGMSTKESFIVGFGMSPRGEVAMIVALIAIKEGLIGQEIYVVIILMSVLTTVITPIVFRNWLYKKEMKGKWVDNGLPRP